MARRFFRILAMNRSGVPLAIGLILLIVTGCAATINRHHAQRYYESGNEAEKTGNLELAKEDYKQALIHAKLGNASPAGISLVTYNLGRVTGYLGDCKEAEQLLLEALDLETKVTGPQSGLTLMRLLELARLNYDQGRYPESVSYYDRAVPIVRELKIDGDDPIAVAEMLDEYADALRKTDLIDKAVRTESIAATIRKRNPVARANFIAKRFKNCTN